MEVSGWNKNRLINLPHELRAKIAALIGANPDEVIVCDYTIVNLFKALKAAMNLQKRT